MNNKYEIYQYLSLVRYKAIFKFLKRFDKKVSIILDLEDSAKDIFSIKNTYKLKKQCRDGIIYFSKHFCDSWVVGPSMLLMYLLFLIDPCHGSGSGKANF